MSGSGNRINYNLRASKSVERKMLVYTLKELFKYFSPQDCRYVGFGSTYFTDFKLFHKELNIEKMISFELEEMLLPRVEFNRPFRCIQIIPGKSTNLLPNIFNESTKDFIWTDYDGELEYDFFNDLEIIMSNVEPGSFYLMSCNKQLKLSMDDFKERFGDLVPIDLTNNDFAGDRDYLTIRRMLLNKIDQVIESRNHALAPDDKLIFRQLIFLTYKDNAPMVSFGGIVDKINSGFSLEKFNLNKFEFISTDHNRFNIDPPMISHKEIYLLNAHLPNTQDDYVNIEELQFIPESDRNRYRKLYKFLPNYMDVLS
jgi:hypothetical protein